MNENFLFLTLVALSSVVQVLGVGSEKAPRSWGWCGVGLFNLALCWICFRFELPYGGITVFACWLITSMLPWIFVRRTLNALSKGNIPVALQQAKRAAFFHPFDAWSLLPRFLSGVIHMQAGRNMEAEIEFSALTKKAVPHMVALLLGRMEQQLKMHASTAPEQEQQRSRLPEFFRHPSGWILLTLLLVFGVQEYFLSQNAGRVLILIGGFLPSAVFAQQEWWRFLSALFLHANFAHLFSNMLGLFVLASFVEKSLGALRFLIIYFGSGIGALGLIFLLWFFGYQEDAFNIGASGCILGLVGASVALCLWIWRKTGQAEFFQEMKSTAFIVVLQVGFDFLNPSNSMTAHLGGAICGFIICLLMLMFAYRAQRY